MTVALMSSRLEAFAQLFTLLYGTVERLEQKVDELSDSPKNTEAESTPVSVRDRKSVV